MDSGRMEMVANGAGHLDTVRALHQTVVSLRTALEVAKSELKQLKEKYEQHSHCLEYADVIEKLTLENHVLRRKIIDSDCVDKESGQNIKLQVTYSPRSPNVEYPGSDIVIESGTDLDSSIHVDLNSAEDPLEPWQESNENSNFCSANKLNEIPEVSETSELNVSADCTPVELQTDPESSHPESSQAISLPNQEEPIKDSRLPSFKTHLELLSKFDVRIKVRTVKDGVHSSGTSDSDSMFDDNKQKESDSKTFEFEERTEHFDNQEDLKGNKVNRKTVATENIKMAVPNEGDGKNKTDKFDVQVRITSEENLVVKENVERNRQKDTLNLDVDDLSLRSLSEGDNSVFSEGMATPVGPEPAAAEAKHEQEASGNESEEVDDIELIFTTDESKDISNLQEDLVSIRESEPWAPNSASTTHSTPVLIKFHTLDPDFQPGAETPNQEIPVLVPESALKVKRVSLPNDKEIRRVAFNAKKSPDPPGRGILKCCDNQSDIALYKRSSNISSRRLDSVDSLTGEYNRAMSFDNTKSSSYDLGSSMDILHRDECLDNFLRTAHLGHRFSVFAERDISKCGTSEDDLAMGLHARRNTCPNPFHYRGPPHRCMSRAPGPVKVPPSSRSECYFVRAAREYSRREHAAQTDMSALPNRWGSDGHLAHRQLSISSAAPTVPQSRTCVPARAPRVPRAPRQPRPPPRDATLLPLSDIDFTSMVPELSRSADPLWVARRQQSEDSISTVSTARYLSRGASARSSAVSEVPHNSGPRPAYPTNAMRPWRRSLPDVRRDDTPPLLSEADAFMRRSVEVLHRSRHDVDVSSLNLGQPYIPMSSKQLRHGHTVKVITPQGGIAVGRVRYVGLAGGSTELLLVMVGLEVPGSTPGGPISDGMYRGRRYFHASPNTTALFVTFPKVIMAWTTPEFPEVRPAYN